MTNIPSIPSSKSAEEKLNALSEAVRAITVELSLDKILRRLAEITAHLVNAKYAALGVPNEEGGMEQFYTYGMSDHEMSQMDHLPLGLGLLGLLIQEPEPIRIENMHQDERAAGFCVHHPYMKTFLGVPIISRGVHLGSLYLSDRLDNQMFSEADQQIVEMLAGHAAIAIENAKLSDRLRKLAVVDERDRISMELHDGIIQSIYAIGIKLELTRLQLDNRENTEAQIKSANQDLNHVIEDIRKYIQDLHVGVDYSMTLQEQLDEIAEGIRQVCEARLVVDVARGFAQLTEAKLHAIMQITREALSNIVRHAHATEVYIDLHPSSGNLNLVISDNGQGFDVARAVMGHGIANIQQRIQQLGGKFEFISEPGRGTTLTVKLPL